MAFSEAPLTISRAPYLGLLSLALRQECDCAAPCDRDDLRYIQAPPVDFDRLCIDMSLLRERLQTLEEYTVMRGFRDVHGYRIRQGKCRGIRVS